MKCARAGILVGLLSLALGAATAHAVVVPVVVGQSVAHAVFAEPVPGQADQQIHNHLLSLIQNTPRGGKIRAAIHSISNMDIANALVEKATTGGVDVEVVYPANKRGSAAAQRLGAIPKIQWCNHGSGTDNWGYGFGCISTHNGTTEDRGTMHAKFMIFSATDVGGLRKNVTWFGSANLTQETGAQTWNDGLTVYDNADLYNKFESLFRRMHADNSFYSGNDFYGAGWEAYFSVPSAALKVHASPEQHSDLVVSRLDEMKVDAGCSVLVGMMQFTRTVVADKLAEMKRGNCNVLVLVGLEETTAPVPPNVLACPAGAPKIGDAVKQTLKSAGISIRAKKIHDKMMLLDANNRKHRVITGSHNLSSDALRENDEILVEVDSPTAYHAFAGHWGQAWSNSCAV